MNAVAMINPEPKNFATKNTHDGSPTPLFLAAKTGNHAPRDEPARMTKMEEIRRPRRPLKSLLVGQSDIEAVGMRLMSEKESDQETTNNRSQNSGVLLRSWLPLEQILLIHVPETRSRITP